MIGWKYLYDRNLTLKRTQEYIQAYETRNDPEAEENPGNYRNEPFLRHFKRNGIAGYGDFCPQHQQGSCRIAALGVYPPRREGQIYILQALAELSQNFSPTLFNKEFERLTIELSWKSSQIEGNTYDLLDTEQLLKYKIESGKNTKEEATMLLNHKYAIDYVKSHADLFNPLKIRDIEDVHAILTKDLGLPRNIRTRLVGITGTQYRPPDNEFQIREYLEAMCLEVNKRSNTFEKALLCILLISYIQPFEDGNKRTGRIVGNGLLMNGNKCPLSYRSVDTVDYKKAILLFYEQNSIRAFKEIFMEQYQFAVENYFL
ncbi:MAG: Fic family protein [Saprospirales bacterium]|nr:Fic family protein [Saprospirales bacterium]